MEDIGRVQNDLGQPVQKSENKNMLAWTEQPDNC